MSIELQPPLGKLADWIRATDRHASRRLPLLQRAQRILAGEQHAPQRQRQGLADQLERWRYQHLDRRGRGLTTRDRRLADALDLAANELAGREPRPPRWPRAAVGDTGCRGNEVSQARACLDADVSLEELARRATELTREHFAAQPTSKRRMLLYAPLYLSSHCVNHCVYCGFRQPHDIQRKHLGRDEALRQAEILRERGFRHVLLVAGDFPSQTTTEYYAELIRALADRDISPAVEIAPQTTSSYAELVAAGACGITLYQETYNEELYTLYHPQGSKASYDWRLEGVERAAEAGMRRLGLGILLGLADPREDLLALIRHAGYLHARFPDRTLAFSLPRIHQAPQGFQTPCPVDDQTLIRLYCALRVAFPRAELVLSTREAVPLRNRLAGICITQMSAGSSTVPGGYEDGAGGQLYGGQFPVSDRRTPAEVARWLERAGFQLAWSLPAR
ncbi:MAG: radical SAM protein [Planctomycetota bacterium]|jgi:2-iminoacetate synthase